MKLITALTFISGLFGYSCGPAIPSEDTPGSVTVWEHYQGPIDIDPPKHLNIYMDASIPGMQERCEDMGGSLFHHTCLSIDY